MGGHVGVACATHLPIARGARRHALAPRTARPARSKAQIWPRVGAAPCPAQPRAVCQNKYIATTATSYLHSFEDFNGRSLVGKNKVKSHTHTHTQRMEFSSH